MSGHTQQVFSATFSPDSARVVTADGHHAKVWDVKTGAELVSLNCHTIVSGAVFSPDGSRIVTACWDQTVKVWDPVTGAELLAVKGFTSRVNSVQFSSDGSRLVSSSGVFGRPGEVKILDARPFGK